MALPYLPPAAQPVNINFDIPVDVVPYMTEFYQATKLAGESRHQFTYRMLKKVSKAWWAGEQERIMREQNRAKNEATAAEVETFVNL